MTKYIISKVNSSIDIAAGWNSPAWAEIKPVKLEQQWKDSIYFPETEVKICYGSDGFYGLFHVNDQYVRAIRKGFNQSVCQDSCVEFFFQPHGTGPYFNFEFNCGGAVLSSYIRDSQRTPNGFADYTMLKPEELSQLKIYHSMPEIVDPEITDPIEWELGFFIPFSILENYSGPLNTQPGQQWKANFYKCGSDMSHPHWISWQSVPVLNFHLPECFGTILFE